MSINAIVVFVLLGPIIYTTSIPVRLVDHAVLIPLSISNLTIVHNRSKEQCLCLARSSYDAMNYFDNGTCQLISKMPCSYQLQVQIDARLYLLNASVSLSRQSCTANLTQLIVKLNNTIAINRSIQTPRCLSTNDQGELITVRNNPSFLNRYDPITLALIGQTSLGATYPLTIVFRDGVYYAGTYFNNILIINSTSMAVISTMTSPNINGPRDIMFINNGYTMVVASADDNFLVFFNRSTTTSTNYTFIYRIPFSHRHPHGLWRVNDSFFYATSFVNHTIFSYSTTDGIFWTETLVVDARSIVTTGTGTHVTVDPDGRLWFSIEDQGALIYDNQGVLLGTFSYPSTSIYDILITENYVMTISSYNSNRLVRLDPQMDN